MGPASPCPLSWLPSDQGGGVVEPLTNQPGHGGPKGRLRGTPWKLPLNGALRLLTATMSWRSLIPFHS